MALRSNCKFSTCLPNTVGLALVVIQKKKKKLCFTGKNSGIFPYETVFYKKVFFFISNVIATSKEIHQAEYISDLRPSDMDSQTKSM